MGAAAVSKSVYWINGPFGVGKTSAAVILVRDLGNAILFDPEAVGSLVATISSRREHDFQDLPLWRHLVVETAAALWEYERSSLIVPMSLLNPRYRHEIFGGLAARGFETMHFVLAAPPEVLRARVGGHDLFPDDPARSERVVNWRLSHIDAYLEALPVLTVDATVIQTEGLTPADVAAILRDYVVDGAE